MSDHQEDAKTALRATYLDNLATTPVDPRVLQSMEPFFTRHFGNPAMTTNVFGGTANAAVEKVRDTVRRSLGGSHQGAVIFTAGATESNNLVIRGIAATGGARRHVITSVIEHNAVLEPCHWLERQGFSVTYLPVTPQGRVDPQSLIQALRDDTALVSIMLVNNETGTIQPLAEIGQATRARGVLLHTDATQGVGKVPFDVQSTGVDLVSLSAHKLYGPKGVGALFAATDSAVESLAPLLLGGTQERGLRAGTSNVPGIVGLGRCLELCELEATEELARIRGLRDLLHQRLSARVDGVYVNGDLDVAVPHVLNVSIDGIRSTALLEQLPDIGLSSTAACGGKNGQSYVLGALGLPEPRVRSALRFGVGRFNTVEDIEYAVERIAGAVRWIRQQRPFKGERLPDPTSEPRAAHGR